MISPEPIARAQSRLRFVVGAVAVLAAGALVAGAPVALHAQVVEGVQKGAREGNKAAGPDRRRARRRDRRRGRRGRRRGRRRHRRQPEGRPACGQAGCGEADAEGCRQRRCPRRQVEDGQGCAKGAKQPQVLTQSGAPTLTAEQIVANSDANIERIKKELNLTPEQEKHWNAFNSAMHYLGNNGADRLKLRIARAQRDPPDDIIEQMRNEAQFLNDRAVDQRNVADAADPLFISLDDKQKQVFINEMVRLSHERGLDCPPSAPKSGSRRRCE